MLRIHGSPSFQTGTRSWKPDRNTSTGRQKCASYPLEASPKKCRSPLQVPCGPLPGLHVVRVGYELRNFIQHSRGLSAASFLRDMMLVSVQGQVSRELPQECGQNPGPVGRHRGPCTQIGIIDAFFGVFPIAQDVPGDRVTVVSIFAGCGGDGPLISIPV